MVRIFESSIGQTEQLIERPALRLRRDTKPEQMKLIQFYADIEEQTIQGFGGAFTQAAAMVYRRMPQDKQQEIINLLFGADGLAYTCGRVPIGACDFSEGNYSYCDEMDVTLAEFSLGQDAQTVLPFLRDAARSAPDISFMASPWSPPAWMKTNSDMCHGGELKQEYYELWAKYIVRFVEACEAEGIHISALTTQNEPAANQVWESCLYSAAQERSFIKDALVPALRKAKRADIGIYIWDHNKERAFIRAREIVDDDLMRMLVKGIAFHWYSGDHFENLALCARHFPQQELCFTEGCVELKATNTTMAAKAASAGRDADVGQAPWAFGEFYAHDIIGNLNAGMHRFIDWNLLLDIQGGPNHVGNYCSAPLICDAANGTVSLQPSYYAISHFSRFIPRGSRRIALSRYTQDVDAVAAVLPDNSKVVVAQNQTDRPVEIVFSDVQKSLLADYVCKPHSLITALFPA